MYVYLFTMWRLTNKLLLCVCVLRISQDQTHTELNKGIEDVTIQLSNELSDSIILVLKLNTNFRNNSLNDRKFKFTNILVELLFGGKFSNLLRPLLQIYIFYCCNCTVKPYRRTIPYSTVTFKHAIFHIGRTMTEIS